MIPGWQRQPRHSWWYIRQAYIFELIGARAAQAPVTDAIIKAMQDYLNKAGLAKKG